MPVKSIFILNLIADYYVSLALISLTILIGDSL